MAELGNARERRSRRSQPSSDDDDDDDLAGRAADSDDARRGPDGAAASAPSGVPPGVVVTAADPHAAAFAKAGPVEQLTRYKCCNLQYGLPAVPLFAIGAVVAAVQTAMSASVGHVLGVLSGIAAVGACAAGAYLLCIRHWPRQSKIHRAMGLVPLLLVWSVGLMWVRSSSPSRATFARSFPNACTKANGCSRIADAIPGGASEGSHRCDPYCEPLSFDASAADVRRAVVDWIDDSFQATVVFDDSVHNYVHARFLSVAIGFADDFGVQIVCNDTASRVWVQSELTFGGNDLGVNPSRTARFMVDMAQARTSLPPGDCTVAA